MRICCVLFTAVLASSAVAQLPPQAILPVAPDAVRPGYELVPVIPRDERESLGKITRPELAAARPDPALPDAERVRLDTSLDWFGSIEDDQPVRSEDMNPDEHAAYNYTVAFAATADPALLEKFAKRNLPFKDMVRESRRDYLRELIHVEGRLKRVRSYPATRQLKAEGIPTLYEGWVTPANDRNFVCVLFTKLPDGVALDRDGIDVPVRLEGYFFKLIRYETRATDAKGDGVWRRAPLLIGATVRPYAIAGNPIVGEFKGLAAGLLLGLFVTVGVLVLVFRRSDRGGKRPAANPFGAEEVSAARGDG